MGDDAGMISIQLLEGLSLMDSPSNVVLPDLAQEFMCILCARVYDASNEQNGTRLYITDQEDEWTIKGNLKWLPRRCR